MVARASSDGPAPSCNLAMLVPAADDVLLVNDKLLTLRAPAEAKPVSTIDRREVARLKLGVQNPRGPGSQKRLVRAGSKSKQFLIESFIN